MPEKELLRDENDFSEAQREQILKKEAEELTALLAYKRHMMVKDRIADMKLQKEIQSLEKRIERIHQKYARSHKQVHEADSKKNDKEMNLPEKEQAEVLDKPENDIVKVQKRIKSILGREKPSDKAEFGKMKDEMKAAFAELIAKRAAFIDPNSARENMIRGDKRNEEHYEEAYNKLMSGENKAFNRTVENMCSYEAMQKIGSLALTKNAGGLMLYMGDRMKKEDITAETKLDRTKEKILQAENEMFLKKN